MALSFRKYKSVTMDRGASEGESMEFRRIKDLIECAQKECEALSLEKKQSKAV